MIYESVDGRHIRGPQKTVARGVDVAPRNLALHISIKASGELQ